MNVGIGLLMYSRKFCCVLDFGDLFSPENAVLG